MAYKRCLAAIGLGLIVVVSAAACASKDIDYAPPPGSTEPAITHYSFGKMVIDGKTYQTNLAILPGGKVCRWPFEESRHEISPDHLKGFLSDQVKTIIIGQGYAGMAYLTSPARDMLEILESKGIRVHVMQSSKAVELYNATSKGGLVAFFHLNC